MEIKSLLETMKPPFSSTDILYDEDAGVKPFICPVFHDDDNSDVFSIDKYGITLGKAFEYISPSNQVICLITAFFNYAARYHIDEIMSAFYNLDIRCDVDGLVSSTVLDYLHRRKEVKWHEENVHIDMMDGCEYHSSDYDMDELSSMDNQFINSLLSELPTLECYGFPFTYKKLRNLLYVDNPQITFIDIPDNLDVIRGKFIDI